jgi:hypothetical protein
LSAKSGALPKIATSTAEWSMRLDAKGTEDFDISRRKGNLEALDTALQDQLGMTPGETRNREVLIVISATEPKLGG